MVKYKYKIIGINMSGKQFESEYIHYDLISAVQKYRKIAYSVDSVSTVERVDHDAKIGICYIKNIEE